MRKNTERLREILSEIDPKDHATQDQMIHVLDDHFGTAMADTRVIDADIVRERIRCDENIDDDTAEALCAQPDTFIERSVHHELDDDFWSALDACTSAAIAVMTDEITNTRD